MSTTNNNALVATAPDFSSDGSDTSQTALAHARPQHVGIRRKTIFDLTETEFNRLEILAQTYAASAFNPESKSKSVHDYKLIMLKGLELGISPMAAVDMINIIQGTPVLDAKGMLALVKLSGLLENIKIDSTDERCVVYIKRSNEEPRAIAYGI